jgi:hypothetical protein
VKKVILSLLIVLTPEIVLADNGSFARHLCKTYPDEYNCFTTHLTGYQTWEEMFPNNYDELQRINRRNTLIWNNHTIAYRKNRSYHFTRETVLPSKIPELGKVIIVDLKDLSFAAYEKGRMEWWGPANGGRKICPEDGKPNCFTPVGTFKIVSKKGYGARSSLYPIECSNKKVCGFHMPWMMQFGPNGEGLHGVKWLEGRNSSHGCVRLTPVDAEWLNKEFVDENTIVKVLPY